MASLQRDHPAALALPCRYLISELSQQQQNTTQIIPGSSAPHDIFGFPNPPRLV